MTERLKKIIVGKIAETKVGDEFKYYIIWSENDDQG